MLDDTESAAGAWLSARGTRREMDIIRDRFPNWTDFQCLSLALGIEILANLDIYGTPDTEPDPEFDPDDDDDPEPWKKAA